jgi:FkbM family methyltransferase
MSLKAAVLRTLPEPLLFQAKRLHYPRAVRMFRPPHAGILQALVEPADWVLDIGANVGWYTRVFSELVGPSGRVLSVEPVPTTFALLEHCVRRLGLDNVDLFNVALSDAPGTAIMEVPRYPDGGDNFYMARIVPADRQSAALRTVAVSVTSVDVLLTGAGARVTLMKCDVEGHELPVMVGAAATLSRCHPALLIEVSYDPDQPGSPAHTLMARLADLGYVAYCFDGRGLARRRPGQRTVDYFFLADKHLTRVRRAGVEIS